MVAAIALTVSTYVAFEVLADPYSDSPFWVGIAAPALTGAWMSIELCWSRSKEPLLVRWGLRTFVLGGLFVLVNTVVHAFVWWQPAADAAQRYPDEYDSAFGAWVTVLLGFDLLGYAASLVGGMFGLIVVLIPFFAIARTPEFADANMLEPGQKHAKAARLGGLGLSVVLLLTFAIPSLILFGEQYGNELMVIIGWALIPVGIVAVVFTAIVQRPDRARRKAAGLL